MSDFALIGAAGYVAPRHLQAIRDTGNRLVAAADPHDAVGVLDRYFLDVRYFPEIERFDRHLEKLRRGPAAERVRYVSICSPNYLHDAHVRLALRVGAVAICEKPLVINPWNLDQLAQIEAETRGAVRTVLQLRLQPELAALKAALAGDGRRHRVKLAYVTGRGAWYHASWKGDEARSGGLAANIGVHLFDLMLWLFGDARRVEVHAADRLTMAGLIELERADVEWLLSVDLARLPFPAAPGARTTHRVIEIDGRAVEFSHGFAELHTRSYQEILAGRGFGIADARPSIELVHGIREAARAARLNDSPLQVT